MAVNKKEALRSRQKMATGTSVSTETLDGTTTTEIVRLACPASKVTVQSTGTLAGNVEFSVNGTDFASTTAFTANALVSFSTHNCVAIKVTRTGGTGTLAIAAT